MEAIRIRLDEERREILRQLDSLGDQKGRRLVDVGCSFGRNLKSISELGWKPVGIDANLASVDELRAQGYLAYTTESFDVEVVGQFDVILMSHIIEHFLPSDLIAFMDKYLSRLRDGGHLIVATPLLTAGFFKDFSHVRPCYPESSLMVYGDTNPQINMKSRFRLQLERVWLRRGPFRLRFHRLCYQPRQVLSLRWLFDATSVGLYVASFGLIGRRNGWVGCFRVTQQR